MANEDHILSQNDDFMALPEIGLTICRAGQKKAAQGLSLADLCSLEGIQSGGCLESILVARGSVP